MTPTLGISAPVRRLSNLWALSQGELELLSGLTWIGSIPPGADMVSEGRPMAPRYVLSGWAARVRWLEDGRRQIVSLVLPGDGLGICERSLPLALCPVVALTHVELADGADMLSAIADASSGLSEASSLAAALDEAYLIDQIVRLGRQTAYERLAHLFLEMHDRLEAIGATQDFSFPMPLTQEMLGDVTGLSIVHVNRTLQQLRRDGMVESGAGRLTLLKPNLMAAIADYRRPEPSQWSRPRTGAPVPGADPDRLLG